MLFFRCFNDFAFGTPRCLCLLSKSVRAGHPMILNGVKLHSFLSSLVEASDVECDELQDQVKETEKGNALRLAVSQLAGEFGRESMLSLRKFFSARRASVISTGSLKLDKALGIGGLPKGRMVEIYGREASGKTTLALHIIKEAQKLGGYCAYIDAENALDLSLVEQMGVNSDNLLVSPPDSAENLLCAVNTLAKSGCVDVIVVDSVAALLPRSELDHMIGCTNGDLQSRIMTQALRKIHYSLCQSQTLIIFVNQVRLNPKSVNGPIEEVTCGGNALRFYAAVRLRLVRMGLMRSENEISGLGVCVEVVKNKLAPGVKKVDLGIEFGRGFSCESEVLELACEHGLIWKEEGKYIIEGEILYNKEAAEIYLTKNDAVLERLILDLRKQLFESD